MNVTYGWEADARKATLARSRSALDRRSAACMPRLKILRYAPRASLRSVVGGSIRCNAQSIAQCPAH